MPDDPELAASAWERHRARALSQQYGWIVIHAPDGWYATRGHGADEETIPDRPASSDRVLESHLMNAQMQDLHARLSLARSA